MCVCVQNSIDAGIGASNQAKSNQDLANSAAGKHLEVNVTGVTVTVTVMVRAATRTRERTHMRTRDTD